QLHAVAGQHALIEQQDQGDQDDAHEEQAKDHGLPLLPRAVHHRRFPGSRAYLRSSCLKSLRLCLVAAAVWASPPVATAVDLASPPPSSAAMSPTCSRTVLPKRL